MSLSRIPCVYMRGGTSRALVFKASDLPADRKDWDAIFLAAMGVPDSNGRNLDGMGGGLSSLNKVCVVGSPSRPDADIDYTFAQCAVKEARVDYAGNCGNMSSAIGPFAVEEGMVPCPPDGEATVRVHNTNTGKIIVARFPVESGALAASGDLAIDGVEGTASPIRLEFIAPGGAKTGRLLPTGKAKDLWDGVDISCIDAANPTVFVSAEALGKTGGESPQDLEADPRFLSRMAAIREAGAELMGIPGSASVPLVAMVSAGGGNSDIQVRMVSMGQPHRATPITGAICLAIACRIAGSLPHALCGASDGPIRIAHPSGTTMVDAALDAAGEADYGAVYRTARRLFEGAVVYRTASG
ncbi:MAG: 2-methylaconitate cis-trans isomerase PrpF family protein [Novosphingobium sp.]